MRRWILALAAVAILAAGTAMADQCQTPCTKAKVSDCGTKAGCTTASACGQKMDCGPAGACDSRGMMNWCERRNLHVSHDPGNIWYRGPAPKGGLFDCAGACGPHGRVERKVIVMKRMGAPDCGPAGACGGSCAQMPACGAKAACGTKASCGTAAACGTKAACGTAATCGTKAACGTAATCGTNAACGTAATCGTKAACGPKRAGSWHTSWSHCPQPKSGCCAH